MSNVSNQTLQERKRLYFAFLSIFVETGWQTFFVCFVLVISISLFDSFPLWYQILFDQESVKTGENFSPKENLLHFMHRSRTLLHIIYYDLPIKAFYIFPSINFVRLLKTKKHAIFF